MANKIRLIEAVSAPEQIIKTDLPAGILSRVRRTICEIGVKNANNRVYEKSVWERVLADPGFKQKLENRQILGRIEHPVESQIKLDQDTSHVVSNIFIDEATNTVKADFDILPTNGGKFIQVLLDAGVKVPCSSRADGELEEAIDEAGNKYSRVIPEAYQFITIDNTGDPSCGVTEPEIIIKATKEGYESHKLTKKTAMALLETVGTEAAKKLEEQIKIDKQHKDCKCILGEKKCSNGSCGHDSLNEIKDFKPGDILISERGNEYQVVELDDKGISLKGLQTGGDSYLVYTDAKNWKLKLKESIEEGLKTSLEKEAGILNLKLVEVTDKEGAWYELQKKESNEMVVKGDIFDIKDYLYQHYNSEGPKIKEGTWVNPIPEFIDYKGKKIKVQKSGPSYIVRVVEKETDKGRSGDTMGYFDTKEEGIKEAQDFIDKLPVKEAIKDDIIKINKDTEKIKNITKELKDELKDEKVNEEAIYHCSVCGEIFDVTKTESGRCEKCEAAHQAKLDKKDVTETTKEEKYDKKREEGKGKIPITGDVPINTVESKNNEGSSSSMGKNTNTTSASSAHGIENLKKPGDYTVILKTDKEYLE